MIDWQPGSLRRMRFLAALGVVAWGCSLSSPAQPKPGWLSAEPQEQRVQLERQLRGFDLAMLETGHRYIDLYWAGQDANWRAAAYALEKIRLAIENGLERRPKRASSARTFLAGPLAAMDEAVAARDPERFAARFQELTAGCNACHAMEQVEFFQVRPPATRVSPIHGASASGQD
jgi:hypothetical protein